MVNKKTIFNRKFLFLAGSAVILIAIAVIISNFILGSTKTTIVEGDLIIPKNEITEKAKFFSYNADGKELEILAVKASDGTIRTAFNTCQVCNGSPRAYYKQEEAALICQNCGNRFNADMIEQQRGGCNPVPITIQEKTDDGKNITISKEFILNNKDLFTSNWKTQ